MNRFLIPLLLTFLVILTLWIGRTKREDPKPQTLPKEVKPQVDFQMTVFADKLGGPRDLEFSPEGILLVSIPTQGKVVALPDKKEVLGNLIRPHGLAFYQGKLFVAEETQVGRYSWDKTSRSATLEKIILQLPQGGRHSTRTIVFNKKGEMFVSIGSSCDVCFETHPFLATVIVSDHDGNNPRVFARGLRNAVFMTLHPQTDQVWVTEMGRDFLGDDLPPDEINILLREGDYGWPNCFGNRIHDTKFDPQPRQERPCEATIPPVFEIQAHSAPLGLTFDQNGDLLVAYHGSWNRSSPVGYKIVKLDVERGKILKEEDLVTSFLKDGQVLGRPVDLIFDQDGRLFVSDDKAGVVYQVTR